MRKEQTFKGQYRKDAGFEAYMKAMNTSLGEAQEQFLDDLPETYPNLHVIGAPRSGTTLAVQLLASYLDTGYINNLIAAFWKAPLFGINLSKKLLGTSFQSELTSTFGRTDAIKEPHEFGYFWNHHLQYDNFRQKPADHEKNIEWPVLAQLIVNMAHLFERPLLFKSFLLGFHARTYQEQLPKSTFVLIKRDFIENALSILKMRRELLGSEDQWVSIMPRQYDELKEKDKYHQVAGQVLFLNFEYQRQLEQLPGNNHFIIDYEQVCANPKHFVERTKSLLAYHGEIKQEREVDCQLHKHHLKNEQNDQIISKLLKAREYWFSKYPQLKAYNFEST